MRLLLDTHIWFWLATEIARLGKKTLVELANAANEIWLSPISTWELLTLHAKGRVRFSGDPDAWLLRATQGIQEAPLTLEIAKRAAQIQMHRDPADRFLVATAEVLDLTLVTADERLLGLGLIRTLANR